jgi:pSer/pThr/pTyr-binding forkhead associated (FHA) protein
MLKLLIETPNGLATLASLKGGQTTVGRAARNDVVLDDSKTSRFHAVIYVARPFHIIRDLSSRNGLYLNGRRISVKALNSGDTLAIGECMIRLIDEEDCDEIVIEGEQAVLGLQRAYGGALEGTRQY